MNTFKNYNNSVLISKKYIYDVINTHIQEIIEELEQKPVYDKLNAVIDAFLAISLKMQYAELIADLTKIKANVQVSHIRYTQNQNGTQSKYLPGKQK